MKTICLALDLKADPILIEEYKRYHKPERIWPEVVDCIRSGGILREQIFLVDTRMVMILTVTDDFDLEGKIAHDSANPTMKRWEELMWKYQQPLPSAGPGEKWVLMEKIFDC